jgi:hypothetical protein
VTTAWYQDPPTSTRMAATTPSSGHRAARIRRSSPTHGAYERPASGSDHPPERFWLGQGTSTVTSKGGMSSMTPSPSCTTTTSSW